MELTPSQKDDLLKRLAARIPRPYDPTHDITTEDLRRQIEVGGRTVSRATLERIVKEAVARGELIEDTAILRGRRCTVYRSTG